MKEPKGTIGCVEEARQADRTAPARTSTLMARTSRAHAAASHPLLPQFLLCGIAVPLLASFSL